MASGVLFGKEVSHPAAETEQGVSPVEHLVQPKPLGVDTRPMDLREHVRFDQDNHAHTFGDILLGLASQLRPRVIHRAHLESDVRSNVL
jgi:hypothetical protein